MFEEAQLDMNIKHQDLYNIRSYCGKKLRILHFNVHIMEKKISINQTSQQIPK